MKEGCVLQPFLWKFCDWKISWKKNGFNRLKNIVYEKSELKPRKTFSLIVTTFNSLFFCGFLSVLSKLSAEQQSRGLFSGKISVKYEEKFSSFWNLKAPMLSIMFGRLSREGGLCCFHLKITKQLLLFFPFELLNVRSGNSTEIPQTCTKKLLSRSKLFFNIGALKISAAMPVYSYAKLKCEKRELC